MKSKKSKTPHSVVSHETTTGSNISLSKKLNTEHLSEREKKLRTEERKRLVHEKILKVKKAVGQVILLLFIMTVIVSMVAIPLLIVFG